MSSWKSTTAFKWHISGTSFVLIGCPFLSYLFYAIDRRDRALGVANLHLRTICYATHCEFLIEVLRSTISVRKTSKFDHNNYSSWRPTANTTHQTCKVLVDVVSEQKRLKCESLFSSCNLLIQRLESLMHILHLSTFLQSSVINPFGSKGGFAF